MKLQNIIFPLFILSFATTSNAKPTQFYKPYKNANTIENIQPKRYLINNVNVVLLSKTDANDFLTQEQIKTQYIQKITEQLKARNQLADEHTPQPISVNFEIKQKRVFAGEDLKFISTKLGSKYAHSTLQYQSTLINHDIELARYTSEEKISLGKKGSISKIVRDLSGSGKPENELEDIDGFAQFMVEQLPK